MDACGAFAAAIAEGIRSGNRDAMFRVAQSHAGTKAVKDALELASKGEAPKGYCGWESGWALLALQNGFCLLVRGVTVEDGLVATVGKGGDTDTNAAIAGALLGAADGLDSIPRRWLMPVRACRPHEALNALNPRPHDLLA